MTVSCQRKLVNITQWPDTDTSTIQYIHYMSIYSMHILFTVHYIFPIELVGTINFVLQSIPFLLCDHFLYSP